MRRFDFLAAAFAALVLAALPQTPFRGQSALMVRLVPADVQTLADALRRVSAQAGVAFVCEGKPFRARKSAPPLLPVIAKWPASGLPLDEAVQKIAGAYDYEAERKGGVFLLRKRYTNADDLPDVTSEELRLSLRDVVRSALGLPAPTVPPSDFMEANSPFMVSFFKTLSAKQKERIFNNGDALPISSLNPQQKEALWQCAVSRHIQDATGQALNAYQSLQTLEQKGTVFFLAKPNEGKKVPLSYAPVRKEKAVFPPFAPNGAIGQNPPVPTDYAADGLALSPFDLTEAAPSQSLQSLCAGGGLSVDPALQSKKVLVIVPQNGEDDKTLREAIFQAAGAVYGLRVFHEQGGTLRMTRARALPVKELAGLDAAVLGAFPEPLLRAFHGAATVGEAKELIYYMKSRENDPDFDPQKPNFAEKIFAHGSGRYDGERAMVSAALHRFRVLLTPRLKNGDVLYADLSQEEKQCLLLALVSGCLNNIDKLNTEQLPPIRETLEGGDISSLITENKYLFPKGIPEELKNTQHFTFYLHLPRPNEKFSSGGQYRVGNITLPTPPK